MQKFKSLWNSIRYFFKKLTVRTIFFAILFTLIALLPTFCALFYVQYTDHTYHSDLFSVALYDQNGVEMLSEEGNPEKATPGSMVDIFYQLHTKKAPLAKPPISSNTETFVIAKISLNGVASELKCYFSTSELNGYCIDQTGKLYSIPNTQNDLFLLSSHGELFYESAILPTLTTVDGDIILPFANEWYYKSVDGQYLLAGRNKIEADSSLYEITGALGIRFGIQPDQCTVSIYKDQRLYQTCSINELPSIPVETDTRLTIDIEAEWFQEDDRTYYGTIHYNFDAKVRNPSTFSVNTETVKSGDFLRLTCTNVTDPAKIQFSSDPNHLTAIFEWDAKTSTAYGILPIPAKTSLQSFSFQLSYGASTKNFEIAIEETPFNTYQNLDWTVPSHLLSEEHFESTMSSLLAYQAPLTQLHYFRGNFLDPQTQGFEIAYHHGDRLQINNQTFTAYGTEFVTDQANDIGVSAWNHGIVLDTGRNYSIGNFVIVDHGCGVRTIYGALGRIDVEPGEIVQKGQQLGSTSTNTRSGKNGFLVCCSVGSTMIQPIYVMGKDLQFAN